MPLQRGIVTILGLLAVLLITGYAFRQQFRDGMPSTTGMDLVQSARHVARGDGLSTSVLRPRLLDRLKINSDGTLPDTAQSPLYVVLCGVAIRLTHSDSPGHGDKAATLISCLFFLTSLATCYLLATRFFGSNGAMLACVLYALSANVMQVAVDVSPVTLGVTLFSLTIIALHALDVQSSVEDRRADWRWAVFAGIAYGLLYMTIYSSLVLVLPIVVYVFLVSKRDFRVVALFLISALFTVAPLLIRNINVAQNPFFNSRLSELIMLTKDFPGYSLYRSVGSSQGTASFLSSGGLLQIFQKMGANLLDYYTGVPHIFGPLVFPLFLVASLTRFTNPQVNRVRFLVYAMLVVHLLGLSLFLPMTDGRFALVMYLPFVSVIGVTFFLNFLRARNLPQFYSRSAIAAWSVLACIPGFVAITGGVGNTQATHDIFRGSAAGTEAARLVENQVGAVRAAGNQMVVSEVPWEVAYRLDVPCLLLPKEGGDLRIAEDRVKRQSSMILLTPTLVLAYTPEEASLWQGVYTNLRTFVDVMRNAKTPDEQKFLMGKLYPEARNLYGELSPVLSGFQPVAVEDQRSRQIAFALILPQARK